MSRSVREVHRLRSHVLEAPFGDDLALFDLETRRLHLLNGSAAAVWTELRTASSVDDIADRIAARFHVELRSIRSDVEQVIDHLRADELVGPDDRVDESPTRPTSSTSIMAIEAGQVSGSYAALDARVGVICDDPEIEAVVASALAPLQSRDRPNVAVEVASAGGGSWTVRVRGRETVLASRLSVALRVIGEINDLAVSSVPDDLVLHAGAVGDATSAVLLPGASNHGKSTLTTALVRDGLRYLTDEAAAIGAGLVVRPFPKAIALDPGSFPLFASLSPPPGALGLANAIAGREWHVDPRRVGEVGTALPVSAVICPHWRAGAATRLTHVEPAEALLMLLGDAFDFSAGGQPVFARLVRIVETVPVYRLGYGDLDDAVRVVRRVLEADTTRDSAISGVDLGRQS